MPPVPRRKPLHRPLRSAPEQIDLDPIPSSRPASSRPPFSRPNDGKRQRTVEPFYLASALEKIAGGAANRGRSFGLRMEYTPKEGVRGRMNSPGILPRHPVLGADDNVKIPRTGIPRTRTVPRRKPGLIKSIVKGSVSQSAERRLAGRDVPVKGIDIFPHTVSKTRRKVAPIPIAPIPIAPKFTAVSKFPFGKGEEDDTSEIEEEQLKQISETAKETTELIRKDMTRARRAFSTATCSSTMICRSSGRKPRRPANLGSASLNRLTTAALPLEATSQPPDKTDNQSENEVEHGSSVGPRIFNCVCGIADHIHKDSARTQLIQCTTCALWSHLRCVQRKEEVSLALSEGGDRPKLFTCLWCAEQRLHAVLSPSSVAADHDTSWCLSVRVLNYASDIWAPRDSKDFSELAKPKRAKAERYDKPSATVMSPTNIERKADNVEMLRSGLQALSLTPQTGTLTERLLCRRMQQDASK